MNVIILVLLLTFANCSKTQSITPTPTIIPSQTSKLDTIVIIGVGDIMLGTNYPSAAYLPPNDANILLPVEAILKSADITVANCEGAFMTEDAPGKNCDNPQYCYSFKMPNHYAKYLVDAGFDFLSVANNHVMDFGQKGKMSTVAVLKQYSLNFAGFEDYPYSIIENNGIKYGFCAFSPHQGTQSIFDLKKAKEIISYLDSIADIVIVSMHIGAEGAKHRNITRQDEYFLGQNRGNPYAFARFAIDAGADVVLGHGPHVTRAVDLYKERFIAYSLGNFATYSRFNLKGVNGIAPIVKVYIDRNGKFLKAQVISIKQEGEGGPVIDENMGAFKEIKTLTQTDIPEAPLIFVDDGTILKK